jgi:hypothetical protein
VTASEPSIDELHATLPDSASPADPWLVVEEVDIRGDGHIRIVGTLAGLSSPATCVVVGLSPAGRRIWPGSSVDLTGDSDVVIEYEFSFADSLAEPEPVDGYYIVALALGESRQYVFVDFRQGTWVAD